jgi:hypothetical protein
MERGRQHKKKLWRRGAAAGERDQLHAGGAGATGSRGGRGGAGSARGEAAARQRDAGQGTPRAGEGAVTMGCCSNHLWGGAGPRIRAAAAEARSRARASASGAGGAAACPPLRCAPCPARRAPGRGGWDGLVLLSMRAEQKRRNGCERAAFGRQQGRRRGAFKEGSSSSVEPPKFRSL